MLRHHGVKVVLCALGAAATMSTSASGAMIAPGLYRLYNHPDGNQRPPLYGLRLDELYNATGGHDVFTFDFDHPSSSVLMNYDGTTITITGTARGGRDTGSTYANDQYLGMYSFSFTYAVGVQSVPDDDDVWVDAANHVNTGTITTPLNDVINLVDERGTFPYSFRLGDEDNDAGHRGFAGISGWGWMNHGPNPDVHVYASDWLFTAELVPTPGALSLSAMSLVLATRRRRAG